MEALVTPVDTSYGTVLVTLDAARVRSENDTGVLCQTVNHEARAEYGPALDVTAYRKLAVAHLVFAEIAHRPSSFSHPQANLIITAVIRQVESFASEQAAQVLAD